MAVEVAANDPAVLACIFFSYPLHPPGKEVCLRLWLISLGRQREALSSAVLAEVVISKELLVQSSSAVRTLLTALQ